LCIFETFGTQLTTRSGVVETLTVTQLVKSFSVF